MDEIEDDVADISDEALEQMFQTKSDDELARRWDSAADWRDWFSCELIYAEQCRRGGRPRERA